MKIIKKLNNLKTYLILANAVLVFLLILFSNLGILPLQKNDFIFLCIITFLFALYRPGWAFVFFTGNIALENINLAPRELGIMLRPYQLIGALTLLAVAIRFAFKRLNFPLPKFKLFDIFPTLIVAGSFLSAWGSDEKLISLKLTLILFSFLVLYFLVRIFIQKFDDLRKICPFFLSSSALVSLYAIWQNIRFVYNLDSFEVMPGRPNATFTESDWLAIFLTLSAAVGFSILYYLRFKLKEKFFSPKIVFLFIFLVINFMALILTVSRSAWLAAFFLYVIYATIVWTDLKFRTKHWQFWETAKHKWFTVGSMILALLLVYFFNLTNFKLLERAQSTGGMQKITIACNKEITLPNSISDISELENYSCQHINLEDIEKNRSEGKFVTEIYRSDPNVNIRKMIYEKSWDAIQKNPLLGIGWGSIGKMLGTDERGTSLNSSNIFLETWLGSGIIGIIGFLAVWIFIFFRAIKNFSETNPDQKIVGLFFILGTVALLMPNFFNAGLLLGILWVFWGLV